MKSKMYNIQFSIGAGEKQTPVKGPLVEFISDRMRQYREPARKGKSKGDLIGHSARRFLATLLQLTNLKVKHQAALTGLRQGALRQWRTEPGFSKLVLQHQIAWEPIYWKNMARYVDEYAEVRARYRALNLKDYADTEPPPFPPERIFTDYMLYGESTFPITGVNPFGKRPRDLTGKESDIVYASHEFRKKVLTKTVKMWTEKDRQNALRLADALKSILAKDEISADDRRRAIDLLHIIIQHLHAAETGACRG
jgi:hypothetical protein